MRLQLKWLAPFGMLLVVASCRQPAVEPGHPLEGVWTVVEIQRTNAGGTGEVFQAQPGQFIFARSHYSAVFVPGPDARQAFATQWQPTPEEVIAACESLIVNSGTYEVSGSRLTVRPMIAKTPEFAGGHQTYEYRIDGDVLSLETVELVSRDGVRLQVTETLTLRRSE